MGECEGFGPNKERHGRVASINASMHGRGLGSQVRVGTSSVAAVKFEVLLCLLHALGLLRSGVTTLRGAGTRWGADLCDDLSTP